VNSQSGKGGVAYVMKAEHGFDLPRRLQIEFSKSIQHITEDSGTEINPDAMWAAFQREYLPDRPSIQLLSHETTTSDAGAKVAAQLLVDGEHRTVHGEGNGPIAAFVHGLKRDLGVTIEVLDYSEHAISAGTDAVAVAYVEVQDGHGNVRWGVGQDESILVASLKGVLSAVNRGR
jgi:2-isopropylmalate synthase